MNIVSSDGFVPTIDKSPDTATEVAATITWPEIFAAFWEYCESLKSMKYSLAL
jgi:hypothetical protein